jgi:hypothetical protein
VVWWLSAFVKITKGHTTSLAEAVKYFLEHILFGVMSDQVSVLTWTMLGIYKRLNAINKESRQYIAMR